MRIPGWLFILGVIFAIGVTALCSVVTFLGARQVALDAGEAGIAVVSFADFFREQPTPIPTSALVVSTAQPTATIAPDIVATVTDPTLEGPVPTLDPLADYQVTDPRVKRILLLGIDQRTGVNDEEKYFRTDTMMVVNIDPVRETIGVLSIPRDLWVDIPDGGPPGRINTANSRGDSGNYPGGGGPALAMETVQNNLGLRVDNYLLVNFDVFTTAVNLLAPQGVEICVSEVIDDPDYPDAGYGYIEVHFDPGCQALDAERLLQYARTRATEGADFDRARRQQEVLAAMKEEIASIEGIGNLVAQAPVLWEELSGSFRTSLKLEEIIGLGTLVQRIPRENIRFGVIDNLHVQFGTTATGDQILFPNYNSIRQLIQQVFNPPEAGMTLAEMRSRAESESAVIAVFNNTDVVGLAGQTRDWLTSKDVTVESVGNTAAITDDLTVVRDYGGNHIWTARYLAALLGLPPDRIQPGADGLLAEGVAVIAGTDIQALLTDQ